MSRIIEPPNPIEVNDFKFLRMRNLKLVAENESVPTDAVNLIAASSRYGLVFIGIVGGFKVLKLENILDLDEDKEKQRHPAEDYSCQKVLTATPVLLALSSDDMTLAVCIVNESRVVADMYDLRAFADMDNIPVPFLTVQLSSHATELCDFMWNPVVVEKYAYCLGDGSLHVHEVVDTTLNIIASLPAETGATSVCWSPKGKQVVVGKKDGSFSQYKPTLQEAKKIPAFNINGLELQVLNICWLTTTSFAVVYVPQANSEDKIPTLVLVTTAKGADVTYTPFGDICLGAGTENKPRYTMYHQPEWGILICASANSVETAVIGCSNIEKASWLQWTLEDGGRADMPLEKYKETYPLGMSLIFCAQRKIVISDTVSYPPMPIIFLLSTNGILCPFHVLNLKPGAVNHVFPSEPIFTEGERKCKGGGTVTPAAPSMSSTTFSAPSSAPPKPLSNFTNQASNTNSMQNSQATPVLSTSNVKTQSNSLMSSVSMFGKTESKGFGFGKSDQSSISAFDQRPQSDITPVTVQKVVPAASSFPSVTNTSKAATAAPPSFQLQSEKKPGAVVPNSLQQESAVTQPARTILSSNNAAKTTFQPVPARIGGDISKNAGTLSPKDKAYISTIIKEVRDFDKELENLKKIASTTNMLIGTNDQMTYIKKSGLTLQDFHKELVESIQSLNLDTHNLKTASLESFAMLGEANSRNLRRNDPKYMSMIRDRALDIMSAKRMRKIRHLYQYLSTQLQEVHDKLDQDWSEYLESQKKKQRNKLRIPSTQAIYQTVVNNQNIIYNLRGYLDHLSESMSKMKQLNASKSQHFMKINDLSSEGELDKLADVLLEDKPPSNTGQKVRFGRKKLPPHVQAALRDALANHRVICVRPKEILTPSQSKLLSTAIFSPGQTKSVKSTTHMTPESKQALPEEVSPNVSPIELETTAFTKTNILPNPPLEVKPLSAFTVKSGQSRPIGGITQGMPVARPTPNSIPQSFKSSADDSQSKSTFSASTPVKSTSAFTQLGHSLITEGKQVSKTQSQPQVCWKSSFFQAPSTTQPTSVTSQAESPVTSSVPNFRLGGIIQVPKTASTFDAKSITTTVIKPILKESIVFSSDTVNASSKYEDITPCSSPSPSSEDASYTEGQNNTDTVVSKPEKKEDQEKNLFGVARTVKPASSMSIKPVSTPPSFTFSLAKSFGSVGETTSVPSSITKAVENQPKSSTDVLVVSTSKDGQVTTQRMPFIKLEKTADGTQETVKPAVSFGSTAQSSAIKSSASMSNVSQAGPKPGVTSSSNLIESVHSPSPLIVVPTPQNAKSTEEGSVTTSKLEPKSSIQEVTSSCQEVSENIVANPVSSSSGTKETPQLSITQVVSKESFFRPANAVTSENSENTNVQVKTVTAETAATSSVPTTTKPVFGSASSTAVTTSSFPQQTTVSSTSSFGQTVLSTSTTTSPFFDQKTTTSSSSFFGSVPGFSTSSSVFGQNAAVTSSSSSFFSQPTTTQSSFFSKPASVFGQAATTTTGSQVFGQLGTSAGSPSPFGQATTTTSPFSQPSFGQASSGSPFGQNTSSPFGQSGFFSQNKIESPAFGQKDQQSGGTSIFGAQSAASGFTFGKSTFGQTPSNTFGLAKAVFGQPASQSSGPFGQSPEQSLFGQSSFFGGLGGKPNEQNASKNVFGSVSESQSSNTSSLFGNQGASSFGSKSGGTFSGSGSFSTSGGSVSQSGFGSFQQMPQKPGGFGSPPAFGSSPTFGGSPSFGGPAPFGGSPPGGILGGSSFGSAQAGFSNFASADAPTFGSLASQGSGFGQSGGFGQQSPQGSVFGSGGGSSVFGGSGNTSAFGGNTSFGSSRPTTSSLHEQSFKTEFASRPEPQPSTGNSSAFTQWRN